MSDKLHYKNQQYNDAPEYTSEIFDVAYDKNWREFSNYVPAPYQNKPINPNEAPIINTNKKFLVIESMMDVLFKESVPFYERLDLLLSSSSSLTNFEDYFNDKLYDFVQELKLDIDFVPGNIIFYLELDSGIHKYYFPISVVLNGNNYLTDDINFLKLEYLPNSIQEIRIQGTLQRGDNRLSFEPIEINVEYLPTTLTKLVLTSIRTEHPNKFIFDNSITSMTFSSKFILYLYTQISEIILKIDHVYKVF